MGEKEKHDEGQSGAQSEGFDIEPVLQALGRRGLGLYQVTQMILQLSSLPGVAFSILSIVFIGEFANSLDFRLKDTINARSVAPFRG